MKKRPQLLVAMMVFTLEAIPTAAAEPATLSGNAAVTDGDTFWIGETVVRLADIDAPELAQTCDGPAKLRSCGAYVADALAERVEGV
jgi:endonuclease YncB( thermonuclease family)